MRLRTRKALPDISKLTSALEDIVADKRDAISKQDYEKAAALRDRESKLRDEIQKAREAWDQKQQAHRPVVGEEDVANVVTTWTGIPVQRMTMAESSRPMQLEDTLHKRVIGQDEAVSAVSRAIRRARAGLQTRSGRWVPSSSGPHRRRKDRAAPGPWRGGDVWG